MLLFLYLYCLSGAASLISLSLCCQELPSLSPNPMLSGATLLISYSHAVRCYPPYLLSPCCQVLPSLSPIPMLSGATLLISYSHVVRCYPPYLLFPCCQVLPSLSPIPMLSGATLLISYSHAVRCYPPYLPIPMLAGAAPFISLLTCSSCLPFLSLPVPAVRCCYPGVSRATCPTPTWTCSSSPLRVCWSSSWFMERSKLSIFKPYVIEKTEE